MQDIQSKLQAPFNPQDIEWRVGQSGINRDGNPWAKVLAYVTNRAIMQRLDDVFGCGGWQNQFRDMANGGVECGISCFIEVGETFQWVTKWDAAPATAIEPIKGGRSDSMKRAAVQWGIGRYLYGLEATFAHCYPDPKRGQNINTKFQNKKNGQAVGDAIWGSWDNPDLPKWALPQPPTGK